MAIAYARSADRLSHLPIWALTTYFNPIHYSSRLHNYRAFRQALTVPLLTVELGYDGAFDLEVTDADILVRVRGTDVLWQKERLLNLALANLPPHVHYVAWLDCDVMLARRDWPQAAIDALRRHEIVQLFSEMYDLPRDAAPAIPTVPRPVTGYSIAHMLACGMKTLADLDPSLPVVPRQFAWGLAWSARRSLLARHGFYDAMVVGSGDRALASAAYGRHDNPIVVTRMNESQKAHYLRWAEPFHADVRGNVGCVEGRLYHLWHGELEHRRYKQRHEAFSAYAFDPARDLVVNRSGAYEWAEHRRDLADFCRSYFSSRLEDGAAARDNQLTAAAARAR
jgi:hypothetical protein